MPERRIIAVAAAVLMIGTAATLWLTDMAAGDEGRNETRAREAIIVLPAAPPRPMAPPAPVATASVVRSDPQADAGVDPPAPRAAGSPNYADLGVLPAL